MRQYELTYLVSDEIKESELNKITGKIGGDIGDLGGKILKEEIWKRRKLIYPIKKQDFATYVTISLELSAEKVKEFERDLRLTPAILRHLLITIDHKNEKLTLTADEIVGTEAIEEVIGEKAFEVVEGETEESKDLMAKRKEAEGKTTEPTEKEDTKEEKKAEKPEKKAEPAGKKTTAKESEADRLAKLDKELDELLKEDL